MICALILFFIVHRSLEECVKEKVSITTDFLEDTIIVPLKADSKQLLWHVAILKQGESEVKFLCSGIVVGHSHILTAASCVENVASSELQVVAGLTLLRSPSHAVENPHSVFTVARKYYPYQSGNLIDDDLAVLKLHTKATFKTPQLTTLQAMDKYSKHCFTLGWGMKNHTSEPSSCSNPSFQDSIHDDLYNQAEKNKPVLYKMLDIRNFMGLSSMFIFQLSKLFGIIPGIHSFGSSSKFSQGLTCSLDEFARIKAVRLSTKHPYKCLCRNTNRLCLYSMGVDDIANQVDIGSPVFCRLKNPKTKSRSTQPLLSKFVLTGIITNKRTEEVHWLKYRSSINMITATNVSSLTEFILAAMFDKN